MGDFQNALLSFSRQIRRELNFSINNEDFRVFGGVRLGFPYPASLPKRRQQLFEP